MRPPCDEFQMLISGFLDEELNSEQQTRLKLHLDACEACQLELQKMQQLVLATTTLKPAPPPEEVWDSFLDGVYNRVERKTGWTLLILGAIALAAFGIYLFIIEPWGPALIKVLIAAPVLGLTIVFISILRERLAAAKTDRYSREIQR